MKGIQIKINAQWIYLPEDFSISLEQTSPVFNEQGTFSFPFEIPLEPNRSVFKNIADPFGDISLRDIDKAPAEIWFAGVLLYRGIIEVDEEVEFQDTLPVTFLSGNGDFMAQIEDMNARDIPLDRDIKLGYVVHKAVLENYDGAYYIEAPLPESIMMDYTECNVEKPYPESPFCNVRVCTSDENGKYKILEADRPNSGVCFYVMYLIDCLFKSLKIRINRNDLIKVEDMCRLAFFNTQCHTERKGDVTNISFNELKNKNLGGENFSLICHKVALAPFPGLVENPVYSESFNYQKQDVYATNENFPDVEITDIINDLSTAFGARFIYNDLTNEMNIVFIKSILLDLEVLTLDIEVLDILISKTKGQGIKLTYGEEEDTAYNYDDYKNTIECSGYAEILSQGISKYDNKVYIDRKTGNAYRVKVNKDTGEDPSLFEVGGFRDYIVGNGQDPETESINYRPVIVNDVSDITSGRMDDGTHNQEFAVFANVELKSDSSFSDILYAKNLFDIFPGELPIESFLQIKVEMTATIEENYDTDAEETSPLQSYDAGYTLGVMRGPGNKSGMEYSPDYDGEGNASWVQTVANYAFTSDSCDNYGRFFDYNGTEEGGADQSGRFSLKLIAGKDGYPVDEQYKDRGLVAKFLSEYLYFMANKKTVVLTVRMNITQIIGIDFLKRYKIGDFVGFINKVSYTLDVNGVTDATIELYTL